MPLPPRTPDPEQTASQESTAADLTRALSAVRATLESATDGILVTNDTGQILNYNHTFVEMWGVPHYALESGDVLRVMDFIRTEIEDRQGYESRLEEIDRSSGEESFDVLGLADGRTFERVSKPLIVDGVREGRVWSFRDVTERQRAKEEHAYLAAIVASSNDAIIGLTLDGMITSWNAA